MTNPDFYQSLLCCTRLPDFRNVHAAEELICGHGGLLPQVASIGWHFNEKVLWTKGRTLRRSQANIKVYEISGHTLLNV
jgi:hypothetical protein